MEAKETKTIKTNKPIMMDGWMIKEIHKVMANHLEVEGKPISFGEATRQLIGLGLEVCRLVETTGDERNGQHHQRTV